MDKDIERWKQAEAWLAECDARLITIWEAEDDKQLSGLAKHVIDAVHELEMRYGAKIKSRETLKAQLEGSLSQATGEKD